MKDESNIPFKAVTRVCVKQMEFQVNGIDSSTARPMTSVPQTYGKFTFFLGSNYGCWQYVWRASVIAPPPITVVRDRSPTETTYQDKLTCLFILSTVHSKLLVVDLLQSSQPNISLCVSAFSLLHAAQLSHSLSCRNCSNSSHKL